MEYSSNDITVATSLQPSAYACALMTTFWIYDYICSLDEEWTFLLCSRWTKIKALYIIARYVPFFIIATDLYIYFARNDSRGVCERATYLSIDEGFISLASSECFFVLRTCALWNSNRIILVAAVSTLFAIIVSSMSIWYIVISTSHSSCSYLPPANIDSTFAVTTSAVPGITGCSWGSRTIQYFMPFILLLVFQLGLFFLTSIRVIQNWRSDKGPLYAILVTHNMFYYACGLLLSVVNVLVPVLHSDSISYFLPKILQIFILAILATRMHLHLWHMDQHVDGSNIVPCIPLSDMPPTDGTV
ncbi:hypothetical protein BDR04DRAFT_331494 [Suillus decipiens]|nr:hypothetical protein BDR04DRAFT_331494 [Suillus decipiens]